MFTRMSANGRKRPLKTAVFQQSERPLSGKADIRRLTGTVLHINARFGVNAPPLPRKPKTRPCAGFFVPATFFFDVRFTPNVDIPS